MIKHLKQKRFQQTILVGSITSLLFLQYFLKDELKKPLITISKQEDALNVNDKILKIFSLGQTRLFAGVLWITTLLESDIDHYKNKDLNSWMYLRFKSISKLDPHFYSNYIFGGQYLSIIKDDILGAKDIYERGLAHYPEDFWLRFNNGFNYYFELGDIDSALDNYEKIENHPLTIKHAPYLPTLLAKMRIEKGEEELAYNLLLTLFNNTEDDHPFKERQRNMLYELKQKIDLDCLNHALKETQKKCDRLDFEKRPYIFKNGKYRAQGIIN